MDESTDTVAPAISQAEPDAQCPSSLGQKRTRDYAEELKGLESSDDEHEEENGNRDPSSPASKKQKMEHSDNRSGSVGLDDGEIVESSPPPAPVESHEPSEPTFNGLPNQDVGPDSAMRPVSEDGEIDSMMHETPNVQATEQPGEPPLEDADNQPSVPHNGWNRGVGLGVRTSFGKGPVASVPTNPLPKPVSAPSSPENTGLGEEENREQEHQPSGSQGETDASAKKSKKSKDQGDELPSTFEASNTTWNFPLKTAQTVAAKGAAQNTSFWITRLEPWIVLLLQANIDDMDRITHKVVRAGFELYVSRKMGYIHGTKKQANIARRAATEAMFASTDKKKLESMISKVRGQLMTGSLNDSTLTDGSTGPEAAGSLNGANKHPVSAEDEVDDELLQQRKYFPGVEDPSQCCLSCSGMGHRAQDCPQLICRFCESKSHTLFGCPTRQRCTKCRGIGHSMETCQEKLALALDEQGGCAICGASHTDDDCSEIWRSYDPMVARKTVKEIPAFCNICGAEGHYGPECGLPGRGRKITGPTTWSQANRALYVDPQSQDVAIAWVDVDMSRLRDGMIPDFRIRGRATRQTHTYFVSSDESEEDLVHAPVKRSGALGDIRIASNIGSAPPGGNRAGRSRNSGQSRRRQGEREFSPPPPPPQNMPPPYPQNGGASWQPPLPSGPPPPLSNNGFQRSLPPAPPGSLPPRPPTFGSSGDSRPPPPSSRGGRGGRGPRGARRGRGRGRGK